MTLLAVTAIDRRARPTPIRTVRAGAYVDGIWTPAEPVQGEIRAFIAAASANDLQHVLRVAPEGDWSQAEWCIWTRHPLRLADDGCEQTASDEIFWAGEWHRVHYAWPRIEGGFTKGIMRAVRDRGRTVSAPADVADPGDGFS